ncbi:MAG: hypothetical protein AAF236_08525 [Verrucomicrobiota bacterium]
MIETTDCLLAVMTMFSIAVVISTLEFFAVRRQFSMPGALDRTVMVPEGFPRVRRWIGIIDGPRCVLFLLVLRAVVAIATIPAIAVDGPAWVPLWVLVGLTAWRNLRFLNTHCTSWSLEMLTYPPIAVLSLFPQNETLALICLGSIAIQTGLAYFGAGFSKLMSGPWRRGDALAWYLTEGQFSMKLGHLISRRPALWKLLTWGVILFEVGFFTCLFLGPAWCAVMMLVGLCFHLSNLVLFGLHPFLWTFVGTYPAIWWVMTRVTEWLR